MEVKLKKNQTCMRVEPVISAIPVISIIYEIKLNMKLKDARAQKFPRTDFFKTLTVGRKW